MKHKNFLRRGQVLVLYALLIPLLFLFVGVGIDLGWYYLNVSRLQNAADAAALAGAWKLVEDNKAMSDYFVDGLISEPSGVKDENYYHGFNVDTGEINESGNSIIDKIDLTKNKLNQNELKEGRVEAREYAAKNLYDVDAEHATIKDEKKIINEWTTDKDVTFKATLFTRILDADRENLSGIASTGFRYYKVELTEKITHMFLGGFDPMEATVVAWAVIKPRDIDLKTILDYKETSDVIQNVLYQKQNASALESYHGKWSHFQDAGVYYTEGDVNRKEVVNVNSDIVRKNSSNGSLGGSSRLSTNDDYAGSFDMSKPDDVDSLHLDFRIEYGFSVKGNDWDLRDDLSKVGTRTTDSLAKGWNANSDAADMRVLTSFNLNYVWPDRDPDDFQTDVLYVKIESDPLWSKYGGSWNSVHQIVLNANGDNTHTEKIGNSEAKYYTKRPFFIFYTGPEVYDVNNTVRVSQPVILNLYNDWNGVLYMPNSPVIINGNGHKLTGFVVAKEYRRLKTADDMIAEGYKEFTDSYGKRLFTKQKFFTKAEVDDLAAERTKETDDKGNITIKEKIDAPQHLILSITRDKFAEYGYGNLDTFKVHGLSTYIADTYKEQFKKFRGITDDNLLTTVKFPTGAWKYVNTEEAYTVAKADLLTAPGTESGVTYIKVIDTADNTEKYLDKDKLPYIKIRRESSRAYISVYDLGNKKNDGDGGYNGVTIQDDSLSASGDNTNSDVGLDDSKNKISVKDHRAVIHTFFKDSPQTWKKYNKDALNVYDGDGYKYFMFNDDVKKYAEPQVLYEFRKVTDADGNVFYLEEKAWEAGNAAYYMEVLPNGSSGKDADGNDVTNPIIVDNWGDLQSVAITPHEVLTVSTEDENDTLESKATRVFGLASEGTLRSYWNTYTRATNSNEKPNDRGQVIDGKYRGHTAAHMKEDYLIPAVERVYDMKKCFNLSEDSRYSYFQLEQLRRVNYQYLNVNELNPDSPQVVDMFFTTRRAGWID